MTKLIVIAALIALAFGALAWTTEIGDPLTRDQVRTLLDHRSGQLEVLLPLVDEGEVTITAGKGSMDVHIGAEECVQLVVSGTLADELEVELREKDGSYGFVRESSGRALVIGWCAARDPVELELHVKLGFLHDRRDPDARVFHHLHRGVVTGESWKTIIGGTYMSRELKTLYRERTAMAAEARAERAELDGSVLFERDVAPTEAWAVPLSATTRWTARRLAGPGHSQAKLTSQDGEPSVGTAVPMNTLTNRRVVLILDARDLPVDGPVPCSKVRVDRLYTPPDSLHRVAFLSDGVVETEGARAPLVDRVCPEDGVVVYTTTADDAAAWRIRIMDDGPPDGPPHARQPTEPPERPITAAHRATVGACRRGDATACLDAAEYLTLSRLAPPNYDAAIELATRACEADPIHCGYLGDYEQQAGRPERAVPAWDEGCDAEDAWSCIQLGEARRLGEGTPFDASGAYAAYQRANRIQPSPFLTERLQAMVTLELAL